MFLTLTFIPSADDQVPGIPHSVDIVSSDSSALIYYTLDSSLPTMSAPLYMGTITLPIDQTVVTLSAIAYSFDGYQYIPSAILSHTWSSDVDQLERFRYADFSGYRYIYPGGAHIPYWFDQHDNPAVYLSVPLEDFLTIVSDQNPDGTYRPDAINDQVLPPDQTPTHDDDQFEIFDTPSNPQFNPNALYIVMDSRAGQPPLTVPVLNGPNMSLRDVRKVNNGSDYYQTQGRNLQSGRIVKMFSDTKNNVLVAYYFDSVACRWIKSISDLPPPPARPAAPPVFTTPIVFRWNLYGRLQSGTGV